MGDDQPSLAIEHFTALIDHAPDFAEGYNARATAFFQTGQFGQSLADIQQTLALNPRHFGAISGLALILGHRLGALEQHLGDMVNERARAATGTDAFSEAQLEASLGEFPSGVLTEFFAQGVA